MPILSLNPVPYSTTLPWYSVVGNIGQGILASNQPGATWQQVLGGGFAQGQQLSRQMLADKRQNFLDQLTQHQVEMEQQRLDAAMKKQQEDEDRRQAMMQSLTGILNAQGTQGNPLIPQAQAEAIKLRAMQDPGAAAGMIPTVLNQIEDNARQVQNMQRQQANADRTYNLSLSQSKEADIGRLMSTGLSRDEAVALQNGRYVTQAPDTFGNVSVIDKATGKLVRSFNPSLDSKAPSEPPPPKEKPPAFSLGTTPIENIARQSVGVGSFAERGANMILGTAGVPGEVNPDTQRAAQSMATFNTKARSAIAMLSNDGRITNQQMKWIDDILTNPRAVFANPTTAYRNMAQLRSFIRDEYDFYSQLGSDPGLTMQMRAANTAKSKALGDLMRLMGPEPTDMGGLPIVKGEDDYNKVPSGTEFIYDDGSGNPKRMKKD